MRVTKQGYTGFSRGIVRDRLVGVGKIYCTRDKRVFNSVLKINICPLRNPKLYK